MFFVIRTEKGGKHTNHLKIIRIGAQIITCNSGRQPLNVLRFLVLCFVFVVYSDLAFGQIISSIDLFLFYGTDSTDSRTI